MSTKLYIVALAAVLAAGSFAVPVYAQGMEQTGGTLDIMLEPAWSDNGGNEGASAQLRVSFIDPATGQLHQHQDYDFVILQNGNEVFRASSVTGQQVIHNVPGTLTVPYTFEQNGDYVVRVELHGIGLPPIPIAPEYSDFPITVTPEFPAGALGAVAAVMAGAIAAARIRMKR